jgi:hypothetical protein
VDKTTMLGISKSASYVPSLDETVDSRFESVSFSQMSFSGPYPRCPLCRAFARPSILMFNADDTKLWVRKQWAEDNWNRYVEAMLGAMRRAPTKLVIVEIGGGVNVPSLRFHSERLAALITKGSTLNFFSFFFSFFCSQNIVRARLQQLCGSILIILMRKKERYNL